MEGVNSFEKGLHRTNSPVEQPEGSYVDALNWIRNDSGRLINEELEEVVRSLPGYKLLGYTPINNLFICFFSINRTDSEIGIFEKGIYTPVFNDATALVNGIPITYKLNFKNQIDCVARIVSLATDPATSGDLVVYFVEKDNPMRRFNISQYKINPNLYNVIDDFNLLLEYKMPYCTLDIKETGGALTSGIYAVVLRYRTAENNKTICNIPTKFISIIDENASDLTTFNIVGKKSDFFDGCPPGTSTSKSIEITTIHVDENYPYVEPIIITYTGLANNLVIKSLGIYDNVENNKILFSSLDQLKDDVSTNEISENAAFYESAECIEQKDNVLILSNLTSKKYDDNFQQIANNIDLYWEIETYVLDSPRYINYPGGTFPLYNATPGFILTSEYNTTVQDISDYGQSNIYQDPTVKKGFQRGEVYSFSITPIYKDGSVGFAYHIPGKPINNTPAFQKRLKYWESSEKYPEYMNKYNINSTNLIWHHQMPDFDEAGQLGGHNFVFDNNIVANTYTNSNINVLRVKAKNINLGNLKNTIQGYIIGYQQRNNDTNTRIIDYGFIRPYLRLNTLASDTYRNGMLTGSAIYRTENVSWSSQNSIEVNSPYAMYHSVDTTFLNREIKSSYYIQKIGYAINSIPVNQSQNPPFYIGDYINPMVLHNTEKSAGALQGKFFFEEGGFYSLPNLKEKLKNAELVPNVYDSQGVTRIGSNINLNQCSSFWHIEIASSNGIIQDGASDFSLFRINQWSIDQIKGSNNNDDKFRLIGRAKLAISRIINDINFQYGPLTSAEYVPTLTRFDDVSLDVVGVDFLELEGDTYVCKTFMKRQDMFPSNGNGNVNTGENFTADALIGFYCESRNNLALRYKEANGAEYYPKNRILYSNNPNNLGIMNRELHTITFPYNKQYSAINNIKLNISIPSFFKEITNFPNRSIYSYSSFESDLVDQYRIFPSNQFHDIPKDRGVITDTFVFNNTLFHHTEYGLWQSYFNPNTVQSTTQGDVVLGNGGIFKIPSKLIVDIKGGYMGTNDKSGTNTPFGRVFLDHAQGKVFLFAGEAPVEISDLGLFPFFREFVNTTNKYCMGYDWANKRLLISNITQDKAISYYPKTQTWTSLHNFAPTFYLTLNRESYAWKDTNESFYNLNNQVGIRKEADITFVENTQPDAFKRFDRIEMNTMSGGNQGIFDPGSVLNTTNYIFKNQSFTNIQCWTDRQNSTKLKLEYAVNDDYTTNFINSYNSALIPVNYYRNSFHAELPLDAVLNPYNNIFDSNNLNVNTDFREHMKGKFLYTKLSYNSQDPLVLNYVKTYFRPSVA